MITVITLCWNEQVLLPFFLRHYSKIADVIVVNDNGSTDNSRSIVKSNPKCVLMDYNTNDKRTNSGHLKIKNELYKKLDGDWFIVVDMDEILIHPNLPEYLKQCDKENITLPTVKGYSMIGEAIPIDDGVTPLTKLITKGVLSLKYSKRAVFHKDVNINYNPGAHSCNPTGRVKDSPDAQITLLHYHWLSEQYATDRHIRYASRQSDEDKRNRWGHEYLKIEEQRAQYICMKADAVTVKEIEKCDTDSSKIQEIVQ